MSNTILKQTRSINLKRSDWATLERLAQAENQSIEGYLTTLIQRVVTLQPDGAEDETLMSQEDFEQRVLHALKEVEAGNYIEVNSIAELHTRLASL